MESLHSDRHNAELTYSGVTYVKPVLCLKRWRISSSRLYYLLFTLSSLHMLGASHKMPDVMVASCKQQLVPQPGHALLQK